MKSLDCLVPPQKDDNSPSLSNEAANMVVDAIVATLKDITEVNKNNISEITNNFEKSLEKFVSKDEPSGESEKEESGKEESEKESSNE